MMIRSLVGHSANSHRASMSSPRSSSSSQQAHNHNHNHHAQNTTNNNALRPSSASNRSGGGSSSLLPATTTTTTNPVAASNGTHHHRQSSSSSGAGVISGSTTGAATAGQTVECPNSTTTSTVSPTVRNGSSAPPVTASAGHRTRSVGCPATNGNNNSSATSSHGHTQRHARRPTVTSVSSTVWEQAIRQCHCLPDGFEQRKTDQGQIHFYNTTSKSTTWYDPRLPREIIQLNLNLTDLGFRLPRGWEERKTPTHANGQKSYFVDHNRKTTQFTDPRLLNRTVLTRLREMLTQTGGNHSGAAVAAADHHTPAGSSATTSSNRSHHHLVGSSGANIHSSTTSTTPAAGSTRHNGSTSDGPVKSHLLGHPNTNGTHCQQQQQQPANKRTLSQKMSIFRQELSVLQPATGHCRIQVSRDNLFEDSYRHIIKMKAKELQKRLMVKFVGEEGLDYGGIAREWLHLLAREMLNPIYGLFQYTREDIYTLQINPDSAINPDHLSYFQFVGRIIGLSIFHGHYINAGFALPFYRMLLDKPVSLVDIEAVDPELYSSLRWILDNDITDVIDNTFSVEHHAFGLVTVKDLKPNGREMIVTQDNKAEYVALYVTYRFMRGIEQQFESLKRGISEVVPMTLLKQFDERELELLIVGLGKIDLTDWKSHTRLKHCNADTQLVKWFWQAVESMTDEQRASLLQFVTGTSRVPLAGFKALQGSTGSSGPRLFTVHMLSDSSTDNLPKAHTCFNRIDIPQYESYEKLREKLVQAIEETMGFNVE